jgi:putative transposon-encoded protein
VVDVSTLTSKGFIGTSRYGGERVDVSFDDGSAGVYLTSEMAGKLHVKKGSRISVVIEDDANQVAETTVASVGKSIRVSDPKVYYSVGREGGAVLRVRKA